MPFVNAWIEDIRQEMRQDVAGTVYAWAKIDGENVSATSATFVVYGPSGTVVQASTSATLTAVESVSRIDCSVPAIGTLDEDYRVDIEFVVSGATYFTSVSFDVVLWPFSQPIVTLTDMLGERPEFGQILDRLAALLGNQVSTTADAGGVYALKGHVVLDGWIRASVSDHNTGVGLGKYTRPYLIINRERLKPVELMLAMREIYKADANDVSEDTTEESGVLYREYSMLAEKAWRSVGPLKFTVDDDLEPEAIEHRVGGVVQQARGW